ncbi:hypothetical protein BO218_00515 [Microbacterium paludicola]|nr:hypothetical protein BO218_00515 [Microbacterium paludicola]
MLLESHHGRRFVVTVAVQARQLVNQHNIDITAIGDPRKHLLECNSLRGLGSRSPGLDVLFDDLKAHLLRLLLARQALRG